MPLPRPSRRALAATLVLFAWVATLGWLAVRRLNRGPFGNEASSAWRRRRRGSRSTAARTRSGRAGITLDTLLTGYLLRETISFETPQDTTVIIASRLTTTSFSPTLQVSAIKSRATRRGWREEWIATTDDGRFRLAADGTRPGEGVAIGVAPSTGAVLPFRLALSGGLVTGTRRTLTSYVGWPGALLPQEAVAGSDSLVVFADSSVVDAASGRLVVAHRDSVRARAVLIRGDGPAERWWIDARGGVLGIETAFGLGWRRTDYDLAANALSAKGAARASFLRSAYPRISALTLPDTTTRTRRFLLGRRDGRQLDPALLAPLATGRQQLDGDTLEVRAAAAAPPADPSEPTPQTRWVATPTHAWWRSPTVHPGRRVTAGCRWCAPCSANCASWWPSTPRSWPRWMDRVASRRDAREWRESRGSSWRRPASRECRPASPSAFAPPVTASRVTPGRR